MQRFLPIFVVMVVSCSPAPTVSEAQDFSATWHDGRAEIDGYDLEVVRYGERRDGEAVLVFVTEPFSDSARVKIEGQPVDDPDAVDVLKLNLVRDFQTGIYDYNTMISLFVRSADFTPMKLTFTGVEWCGHVYDEMIFRRDAIHENYFSYFQGETRTATLPARADGIVEDDLYILLRGLRGPFLEPGGSVRRPFLPSPFHTRLVHRDVEWGEATIERSRQTSRTTVPAGVFETYEYVVEAGDREGRFLIEVVAPHRIVQWSWATSGGGGEASETGRLTGSARLAYWQLNGNGDESYRERLGLSPRAR